MRGTRPRIKTGGRRPTCLQEDPAADAVAASGAEVSFFAAVPPWPRWRNARRDNTALPCLAAFTLWPTSDAAPDDNAGPGRGAEAGGGGNEQGA
ncbi:hypothetical protein ACK1FJ_004536 [Salmonella enterica]